MNTCWQAFLDTGPLALLPLADPEKVAIVWSLDEAEHERIASLPDEAFLRALNHALGQDAPAAAALGPRASFPLRQAHAVEYIDQGLVLVADAARSIHPLAGQGINLGLSDVRVLAGELASGKANGLLGLRPCPVEAIPASAQNRKLGDDGRDGSVQAGLWHSESRCRAGAQYRTQRR